jgi:curved DNA-binding protein CbpA
MVQSPPLAQESKSRLLTGTEVLGIESSASKAEIKKAYHKVCAALQTCPMRY